MGIAYGDPVSNVLGFGRNLYRPSDVVAVLLRGLVAVAATAGQFVILLPKTKRFVSRKLLGDAEDYTCVWHRHRECCSCHLPDYDAGHGQKCHDWQTFHGCLECNTASDNIYRHDYEWRFRALKWTLERRFASGLLLVRK